MAQAPTNKSNGAPSAPKQWAPPRTAWGDPNIQGVWQGSESIALERALSFEDKEFFTDAEIEERVERAHAAEQARKALISEGKVEHQGFRAVPNYNAIFEYSESDAPPRISNRTSAIVDPPNGRIPAWTLDQVKHWEAREAATK